MRTLRTGTKKAGAFVAVVAALGLAGGIIGPVGAAGSPGNIKIQGVALDPATNNEPHVRCKPPTYGVGGWGELEDFQVVFFKYGDTDKVKLLVETVSPTPESVLWETPEKDGDGGYGVPAGGNPGTSGGLSTEMSTWLTGLDQPKQGYYHVRITALSKDGSKSSKVVWVDPCGPGDVQTS